MLEDSGIPSKSLNVGGKFPILTGQVETCLIGYISPSTPVVLLSSRNEQSECANILFELCLGCEYTL
jgi:hypothetical protein